MRKKILIDTDLGDDIDDAAALMMAFNSPELDIVGITTVFLDTEKRARMVTDLCGWYGKTDIPVLAGARSPLIERPDINQEPIQYGILRNENLYEPDRSEDAADFIIRMVRENPDLIIVEMGEMTNLGIAFYREPQLMKNVEIIAMGGVFKNCYPEWNLKCDPEAARIVMDYANNLKMFGLDVTKYCKLPPELLESLCTKENERMQYYKRGTEIFRESTGYIMTLHDALLIAYLVCEDVVTLKKEDFTVELNGEKTRGAIVLQGNAYDLETESKREFYYAEHVDLEKFYAIVKEKLR